MRLVKLKQQFLSPKIEILLFSIKTPLIEELERRRQHYLDLYYCE